MSTDEKVASKLAKTLENGKLGFERAAEKLDDGHPDVATRFREFAAERGAMGDEIAGLAAAYGDDVDQDSTVAGALHRGWIAVKDALTSDDSDAVIGAAATGEEHAEKEYADALSESDLSPEFRSILERQAEKVRAAHRYVQSLTEG
jgi:uncharacterized protein (TIGR02284 family)